MDLLVGVMIALSAAVVGSVIGVVAGYAGGLIDELFMRVTDVILAFPGFVLALIIVAVLGEGVPNVVVAVAVAYSPYFVRLTRSRALAEREREYVDAAALSGNPRWRIALRHVMPTLSARLTPRPRWSPDGPSSMLPVSRSLVSASSRPPRSGE